MDCWFFLKEKRFGCNRLIPKVWNDDKIKSPSGLPRIASGFEENKERADMKDERE